LAYQAFYSTLFPKDDQNSNKNNGIDSPKRSIARSARNVNPIF